MGDFQLFKYNNNKVEEIKGTSVALEKALQNLIEKHLETFIGVRFLESEYSTGKVHGGRIDSLGIDENGCPVIIEYKRSTNENVINQGLYYLDWLMDHKAEFELLVMNKFGKETSEQIEWGSPRLICIAGDFTKYDSHAVQQIDRNISLMRYKKFGEDLLMLELVNSTTSSSKIKETAEHAPVSKPTKKYKLITDFYNDMSQDMKDLYEDIRNFIISLGDDVQENTLMYYIDFKEGLIRDVSNLGRLSPCNIETTIKDASDFEKIKPLIIDSYHSN
jgi:predicted transport protein